jgi:hypothetical protein
MLLLSCELLSCCQLTVWKTNEEWNGFADGVKEKERKYKIFSRSQMLKNCCKISLLSCENFELICFGTCNYIPVIYIYIYISSTQGKQIWLFLTKPVILFFYLEKLPSCNSPISFISAAETHTDVKHQYQIESILPTTETTSWKPNMLTRSSLSYYG